MEAYVRFLATVTAACANRTGAAARESLRRDRPVGLTSPAFHAYGSASFLVRAHTLPAYIRHSLATVLGSLLKCTTSYIDTAYCIEFACLLFLCPSGVVAQ